MRLGVDLIRWLGINAECAASSPATFAETV